MAGKCAFGMYMITAKVYLDQHQDSGMKLQQSGLLTTADVCQRSEQDVGGSIHAGAEFERLDSCPNCEL